MKKFPQILKPQGHSLFKSPGGNLKEDSKDRHHDRLPNDTSTLSAGQMALAKCDGPWTVGRHLVNPEEVIAEGGFGVVFLVKVIKDLNHSSDKNRPTSGSSHDR